MHSSNQKHPSLLRRHSLLGVVLLVALFPLLFAACRSAPEPEQEVSRKNQAARFAEFGNTQYNRGNYDLALRYFDLSLAENVAIDNLPGIAQSYNSIGRVFIAAGNTREAEANFRSAIQFADLAGSSEHRMQAHVNLAVVALQNDDEESARQYLDLARAAVEAREAKPNSILYHNLGILYARQNRFDEARSNIDRARSLNQEDRRWPELASNHYMLASILSRQGRYPEALEEAKRALDYDKRAENSPGIAADLYALGKISANMEDHEDAYQYYLRSLRIHLALNQPGPSMELLALLEETALRTNREQEAVEFAAQRERIESALTSRLAPRERETAR
ncbi:MAG: tetratricopeptide repeat protein [Spirochaetaceae bacterium]|nr:MAG: tetratricopeptide repeat protein [Spirochaetaceae bacterium]